MTRAGTALGHADNTTARTLIDAVTHVRAALCRRLADARPYAAGAGDDAGAMISLQKAVLLNPREFKAMAELARDAGGLWRQARRP